MVESNLVHVAFIDSLPLDIEYRIPIPLSFTRVVSISIS